VVARLFFAEPAIGDDGIGVDAAIAEERPISASLFALGGITLDDKNFFLVVGGFGENLAEGIGDEGIAPKLNAGIALVRLAFKADTIDDRDIGAIGNGMGALNGFPCVELSSADLRFLVRVPADAGGIKNNLRALKSGDAGTFGIPLIPTNLNADAGEFGVEVEKAEIAGGEIKFFVVERIVGNVHLAIFAEVGAVGVEDGAGIVVNAGGAAFKNGNDESNFLFFGDLGEALGGRTGNGFGEIEEFGVFGAAKIFAGEKFVETDDLSATRGRFADLFGSAKEIFFFVGGARHLHETDRKFIRHANYLNTREFFECERELFFPSVKVCTINSVAIALQSRNNVMGG
jgi:hypothetical protein